MTGEVKVHAYHNGAFGGAFDDVSGACLRLAIKRNNALVAELTAKGIWRSAKKGDVVEIVNLDSPAGRWEDKLRQLCILARGTDGAEKVIDETIRRLNAMRSGASLDWAKSKENKTRGRNKQC